MLGNTDRSDTDRASVACDGRRTASVKIIGSVVQGDFHPRYRGNIDLLATDIVLEKE